MNAQSPHKWWSTLKSAVFGLSLSLPLLVGEGGGLVRESVGKADLLLDQFDGKQSRKSVDLLLAGHPFPIEIAISQGDPDSSFPLWHISVTEM